MRVAPRLLLLATLLVSPSVEANPTGFVPGFRPDTWDDQHGLPQNTVTDLTQDRDGFLWVSTFGGVARFDGTTFDVVGYANGLRSPRTLALAVGTNDDLWVGLEGRGLQHIADGRVVARPEAASMSTGEVEMLFWADETLWAVNDRRLMKWVDGVWTTVVDHVYRAAPAGRAGVVFTQGGRLQRLADGRTEPIVEVRDRILSVSVLGDGLIHFVTEDGLYRVHEGRAEHLVASSADGARWARGPIVDLDGHLWFTLDGALHFVPSLEWLNGGTADGPVLAPHVVRWSTVIRALYADRERNLWVGASGHGLWRLKPVPVDHYPPRHTAARSVTGIVAAGEDMIFGNQCYAYTRLSPDGSQQAVPVQDCIEAMAHDESTGALWVCTESALERHGEEREVFSLPDEGDVCTALLVEAGRVVLGTRFGKLYRFDDSRLQPIDAPVKGPIATLARAPDGALWVGGDGRVVVVGDAPHVRTEANGIPPGEVRAIRFHDEDVFIGTYGGGLVRFTTGGLQHFTTAEGLLDDFVSYIAIDEDDGVWVTGNLGVFGATLAEYDAVGSGERAMLRGQPIRLFETEGYASPPGSFDGSKLWVPTVEGVCVVRLDAVEANQVAPVAVITDATVDGRPVTPGEATDLPPGRGALSVQFRAAMLREPGLRTFEYRLLGLSDAWLRVPGRREQAFFDGLAPGSYRFEVRAINEDRVVGPTAGFTFDLPPHVTETLPFRGGLVVLFLGLVYAWSAWRTRRIDRQNQELSRQIDSRLVAEAALRDREMHYRSVFRSAENGFLVVGVDRVVLDANPAACTMFGYAPEELLDQPLSSIVHVTEGDNEASVQACRRKDGTSFEARVQVATYAFGGSTRTLVSVVDLSPLVAAHAEERRLREQLLRSQRVDAMGRLAGGIAHDINNMLTAVKCYADLALMSLESGDGGAARADLLEIGSGVERTTTLTKKLLAFGRRESVQPRYVALDRIVRSMLPMLSRLLRDDIDIAFEVEGQVGAVYADPAHLEQVLVNLVINASQAMPRGGTIALSIEQLDESDLEERYAGRGLVGPHVRLAVVDDGIGMSQDVLDRVFEPFYSTKESQENSGLGLSVVHGIVSQAGGQVVVESRLGVGTRFDVLFPASDSADPSADMTADDAIVEPGRGERLLYCDDDAGARAATARILERGGYEVLVADSPSAAITLAKTSSVALLVTDVVMPKMNGRELFEALRASGAVDRVLYVSGYTQAAIDDLRPEERFLPKPYEPKHLLREVRALLDEAPPASVDSKS